MPAITRSNSSRRVICSNRLAAQRVEMNIDAAKSGFIQRPGLRRQATPRSSSARYRRFPASHEIRSIKHGQIAFAPAAPRLSIASCRRPGRPRCATTRSISSNREYLPSAPNLHVLRHAVVAADIAPVRDADAQIVVQCVRRCRQSIIALLDRQHALDRQRARARRISGAISTRG